MYRYFNICGDAEFKTYVDGDQALSCVLNSEQMDQQSAARFRYAGQDAWFLVSILECDRNGNHSSNGELPRRVNLVEVTASTGSEKAITISRAIASRLGWNVTEVTLE